MSQGQEQGLLPFLGGTEVAVHVPGAHALGRSCLVFAEAGVSAGEKWSWQNQLCAPGGSPGASLFHFVTER